MPASAAEFRRVNAQGVIIPAEIAKKEATGYWYTQFWTPTDRDIQDLEMRLPTFLKEEARRRSRDRDKNDPVEVGRNLKDSARQYIGVFWRGRKFIFVNGFPLHERFDWTRQFVLVSDGGSAFWSVLYDVERKTFEQLSVNGVA
jgi:hypothetical protein